MTSLACIFAIHGIHGREGGGGGLLLKSHRAESLEVRDLKVQYFDTLSIKEQRLTTGENNRAKI